MRRTSGVLNCHFPCDALWSAGFLSWLCHVADDSSTVQYRTTVSTFRCVSPELHARATRLLVDFRPLTLPLAQLSCLLRKLWSVRVCGSCASRLKESDRHSTPVPPFVSQPSLITLSSSLGRLCWMWAPGAAYWLYGRRRLAQVRSAVVVERGRAQSRAGAVGVRLRLRKRCCIAIGSCSRCHCASCIRVCGEGCFGRTEFGTCPAWYPSLRDLGWKGLYRRDQGLDASS